MPGFFHLGEEKNPQTHQNPVARFPVQLACSFPGFYSHHQSGLTDWEQTSGSPWTHTVPFPSQNKHQVIGREKEREKKLFSWLRSQFRVKPNSDSRQQCFEAEAEAVLEGGASNSGLQARISLWVSLEGEAMDGLPCSPGSSLFPGIKSGSLWGSLLWSR